MYVIIVKHENNWVGERYAIYLVVSGGQLDKENTNLVMEQ